MVSGILMLFVMVLINMCMYVCMNSFLGSIEYP